MADFNLPPVIVGPEPAPAPSQLDQFRAKLLGASQGFADQHPDAYRAMRAGGHIGSGLEAMGVIPNPEALKAASFAAGAQGLPMPEAERPIGFGAGAGPAPAQSTTLTPSVSLLGAPPKLQMPGGGGGGYGGGPSPMSRLAGAVAQDNKDLLGTYDTQKDQQIQRGEMEAKQLGDVAGIQQLMAQRQQQLAQDRAAEAADAAARFEDWTKATEAKVAALGEMKVDPSRMFSKMGNGEKVMMMIGGALGGVLQGAGLTAQNEFVKSVRERVQDDIQAQQGEIEGKNREVAQRNTLLGQFMGIHGDKRLATMQAENQLLDGTRQYLLAQADKDNLPPQARQNALMAAGLLNREQVTLRKGIDSAALQAAQQQAAAAASAQAAAQKQAWDRSMQVAEMGLKRDQLAVEALKASGASTKELDSNVAEMSKRLADDKVMKNKTLVDDMYRRIADQGGAIDSTKGMPGTGPLADAREAIAPSWGAASTLQKVATVHPGTAIPYGIVRAVAGLNPEERVSRQDWEMAQLAYQTFVTGSGGSDEQMAKINAAFRGANTAAEQANAIRIMKGAYDDYESKTRAGYSSDVRSTYDARLKGGANSPMPQSVQLKSFADKLGVKR
jgi:hypothetical protein